MELPREFRFEFTIEDYVRYNLDHDAKTGQSRKTYFVLLAVMSLAIAAPTALTLLFSGWRPETLKPAGGVLAFLVLFWLFLFQSRRKSIDQATRKAVSHPEGGSALVGPRRVVFDEKGIRVEYEHQLHEIAWGGILAVDQGPDHLYFYFSPLQAVVLPRRCFKTDSDFEAFAQSARTLLFKPFEK